MKKIIFLIVTFYLVFSLFACETNKNDVSPNENRDIATNDNPQTKGKPSNLANSNNHNQASNLKNMSNTDTMPFENKEPYVLYENARTGYITSVHTPIFEKTTVTSEIVGIYEPSTEVQVLGDSALWYYISINEVTGYTPYRSLAFDKADVPDVAQKSPNAENEIVRIAEQEVKDGHVSVRFVNTSENEQIVYDFIMLPYNREGALLPDKIRILSLDMNPPTKSGEITAEGLSWHVDKDIFNIKVCILNVVYWDDDLMRTWFNPYAGDWLLTRLEEAELQ